MCFGKMSNKESNSDIATMGKYASIGASVGILVSFTFGNAGLAFAGVAVGVGAFIMAIVGAIVGIAVYGLKKSVYG